MDLPTWEDVLRDRDVRRTGLAILFYAVLNTAANYQVLLRQTDFAAALGMNIKTIQQGISVLFEKGYMLRDGNHYYLAPSLSIEETARIALRKRNQLPDLLEGNE